MHITIYYTYAYTILYSGDMIYPNDIQIEAIGL